MQRTMNRLRGGALIPRGVYRFTDHEEADEWMIRTIADTHAHPELEDLLTLGQALNAEGVRYVLIGGFAVLHGFVRAIKDIDLLIDASSENRRCTFDSLTFSADESISR